MEANSYRCQNCGGQMEFDPKSQALKCTSCGTEKQLNTEIAKGRHNIVDYENRFQKQQGEIKRMMECKSCGATIEIDPNITSTTCPYCASNVVLADKAVSTLPPDGLRPFAVDRKKVGELFSNWLKGKWFAPNELKNLFQSGKIFGIYLPFWSFDNTADFDYRAEGGRDRTISYQENGQTKTRTETDWFTVTGNLMKGFKNFISRGSKTIKAELLRSVGGYDLDKTVGYEPSYLSGYGSEIFEIPMGESYDEAKKAMVQQLESMVAQEVRKNFDQVRNIHLDVRWSQEFYRLLLLPVYSMSYSYNGKTYQILVNGETGAITGEYPKSKLKIALVVLGIVAVIALIVFLIKRGG